MIEKFDTISIEFVTDYFSQYRYNTYIDKMALIEMLEVSENLGFT